MALMRMSVSARVFSLLLFGLPLSVPAVAQPVDSPVVDPVVAAAPSRDRVRLNQRVFDRVWSEVRRGYYDPTLHGVDWNAARATFRPQALAASDRGRDVVAADFCVPMLALAAKKYALRQQDASTGGVPRGMAADSMLLPLPAERFAGDTVSFGLRNVADLHMFPNELTAIRVSGKVIADWLEMSAGVFLQLDPDVSESQPLMSRTIPAYSFDVIYGLEYRIDPTSPARFGADGTLLDPTAHRVRDLRWNGAPLDPDQMFIVAVNSYRAGGGGDFPGLCGAQTIYDAHHRVRDCIVHYLRHPVPSLWPDDAPWALAPLDGIKVSFETGPGARAHLGELAAFSPVDRGLTDQGFLRLELTL